MQLSKTMKRHSEKGIEMRGYCQTCGKRMAPVEAILGAKCGECIRKLHRAVVEGKQIENKLKKKARK